MKRCADCHEWKPLEEFPRNRTQEDGRHTYCKPCHNARTAETRQRLYGGGRHYHQKRRYGIGAAEVDELIRRQGGVCLICSREDPEHVDHDHKTGEVRGILCFNCNGGLGQFSDNAERLMNAVEYLESGGEARIEAPELRQMASDRASALLRVG
jgi:hypothetical protein